MDIVQSVWKSLLMRKSRLVRFDDPGRLIRYLVAMAHNKVLETYRHFTKFERSNIRRERRLSDVASESRYARNRFRMRDVLVSREATASAVAQARELWSTTKKQCSSKELELIQMRMNGMTYTEAAAKLGVSKRTVQRMLLRILRRMNHDQTVRRR